jgi:threonine dehydrogenase-like Zn-dependent dehydrogenase
MLDALCSALHPILRHFPENDSTVLVMGAGTIGLCAVAALRALGSQARILVLAKYPFQGDLARGYGADEVAYLDNDHIQVLAKLTGARIYQPVLGKPVPVGGADLVYECVGNDSSIDDALRLARAGGMVVLVGAAAVPKGVDCTPIWFRELTVVGSYAVAMESYQDQKVRTYEVGLDLMAQGKLDLVPLLTHKFRLADYRRAFRTLAARGSNRALKAVFTYE